MSPETRAEDKELGTAEKVRNTVNDELPEDADGNVAHAIPDAAIERALAAARVDVDSEARGGPRVAQLREAVIAVAASNLVGYDSTIKQIAGGDESITFNTDAWAANLEANEARALKHVRQFFSVSL